MNKPYVFCAEDNNTDIILMQRVFNLRLKEFDCFFQTNVRDAVQFLNEAYAKKNLPALILLDIKLINSNGLDLLKSIKQDTRFDDIPVLMLSSSDLENDKVVAKEYGCDDYIEKPKSYVDLKSKLFEIVHLWAKIKNDDTKEN